jgi:hypothetical protein
MMQCSMYSILEEALRTLNDHQLSAAIAAGFERQLGSLQIVEETFELLTSNIWTKVRLQDFFNAWRDTHLSSSSVAAIVCRLLTESDTGTPGSYCFIEAARSIAKVIHEDLGLCGETHSDLYERMANRICLGDDWKLSKHRIQSAYEFGRWVHGKRVDADLDQSLFVTISSEIYNHCEYTFIAPLFRNWMQNLLAFESDQIPRFMAYILVHTGPTESDHFLHGINSLQDYYSGVNVNLSHSAITESVVEYLVNLEKAYRDIYSCLSDEQSISVPAHTFAR